jgi:hypothetical protein
MFERCDIIICEKLSQLFPAVKRQDGVERVQLLGAGELVFDALFHRVCSFIHVTVPWASTGP